MISLNQIFAWLAAALVCLTVLSQTALWQRKEYRWDRLLAAYRQGELKTSSSWLIVLSALFFWLSWITLLFLPQAFSLLLVWAAIACFVLYHLERIWHRGILRPQLTLRAVLVTTLSYLLLIFYLAIYLVEGLEISLQLLTVLYFAPLVVASSSLLVAVIASGRKRKIIQKALRHREKLHELTVIGITGSYGKTTTKVFLNHLLQHSGHLTVATREHRNSVFPVAQDMLQQLTSEISFYVAEMGAYRQGEIKELSRLTKPQIGLITAIGSQHQALFGSAQKITAAKWELIEALPAKGIAVLNADDENILYQAEKYQGKIIWFSSRQKVEVYVSEMEVKLTAIIATFHFPSFKQRISLPVIGRSKLDNALAAAATAYAVGLKPAQIMAGLVSLPPTPNALELHSGSNGKIILDDSYSANEAGVLAALDHLRLVPSQTRLVVMDPLIELGEATDAVHFKIGQALAQVATDVILTRPQSASALRQGLGSKASILTVTQHPGETIKKIKEIRSPGAVAIIGRIPDLVRQTIREEA